MATARHVRITRDVVMFASGVILTFYEAVIRDLQARVEPRPYLIVLYATMMGIPAFTRAWTKGNGDNDAKRP